MAEIDNLGVVDPVPFHDEPGFGEAGEFTGYSEWFLGPVVIPPRGVLWSHVADVNNLFAFPQAYASRANHYEVATFGVGLPPLSPQGFIPIDPCRSLPYPICPQCPILFDMPNWVYDPLQPRILVRGIGQEIDVTPQVSPAVLTAFGASGVRWVPVSETPGWLGDGDARLASVTLDGSNVVVAVAAQGEMLVDIAHRSGIGGAENLETTLQPPPRTRFGLVLSGSEKTLFVFGGVLPSLEPAHDVWRFHFAAQQWQKLPIEGDLPEKVLAAAFRPEDRSIYLVDEVTIGNQLRARLLRLDVGSLSTQVLEIVPRHPHRDRVFLTNAPKGDLLLLSSSTTQQKFTAARFTRGSNGNILLKKGFDGQGIIALEPTMTARGVTLPLMEGNTVKNTFLMDKDLKPGAFHPIGKCL